MLDGMKKEEKRATEIVRVSTPEQLTAFYEAKMMTIIFHKKGLLHQVNEIILEPKRLSFSDGGIKVTQKALMEKMANYLTVEEIDESKELVTLLIGTDLK